MAAHVELAGGAAEHRDWVQELYTAASAAGVATTDTPSKDAKAVNVTANRLVQERRVRCAVCTEPPYERTGGDGQRRSWFLFPTESGKPRDARVNFTRQPGSRAQRRIRPMSRFPEHSRTVACRHATGKTAVRRRPIGLTAPTPGRGG